MKKLLTLKQQSESLEGISDLVYTRYRESQSRFTKGNIISDIENGIEITFGNSEYWNDIGLSQLEHGEQIHDKYRVGDKVSAFDYIKDPYDILYVVDSDGVYKGGMVNVGWSHPSIRIDTINKQVIYTGFGFLQYYPYARDSININKVLKEYWKSNQCFFDMKKLLTNKQQITIKQQMEEARELNPHCLLTEELLAKIHKNESRLGKRDVASDIENAIEITEDNIEEWNDDGQYSVGDYVLAQDYIKDPYDILYLIDIDGVYLGGMVFLTVPGFSRTGATIRIDTVYRKVIHTRFGHSTSKSYDFDSMRIDRLLEESWKMGRGVQTTLNLKHSDSYYSYRDWE